MDAGVGGIRKPQHRITAGWGSRRQIGICRYILFRNSSAWMRFENM